MNNEKSLKEWLESRNRKKSAIVVIIETRIEASKHYAKRLRFGRASKVVDKYWQAGPSSICITCLGISHNQLEGCNERSPYYTICLKI